MAEPIVAQPETVPKTEFDRVTAEAKDAKQGLEAVRNQLLSQDYLDYLAAKNAKPAAPAAATLPTNLGAMTLAELTAYIDKRTVELVNPTITNIQTVLKDVQVKQELEEVRERHDDFETLRPKIVEILSSAANDLTIEQAYYMAKAQAPAKAATPPAPAATPPQKGNERPGGTLPVSGDTLPKFKDGKDAGQAAWASVAAKHGILGDTI